MDSYWCKGRSWTAPPPWWADDVGAPAEVGEAVGEPGGEGKGGVAPAVELVTGGRHFLHSWSFSPFGRLDRKAACRKEPGKGLAPHRRASSTRLDDRHLVYWGPSRMELMSFLQIRQGRIIVAAEELGSGGSNEGGMGHARRRQPDSAGA